jgi:hypothetical protein
VRWVLTPLLTSTKVLAYEYKSTDTDAALRCRVLWRGSGLELLKYDSVMSVRGSDHKPVVALFNMKVKDGVEEAAERLVDEVVQALGVAEDQIDCVPSGALRP